MDIVFVVVLIVALVICVFILAFCAFQKGQRKRENFSRNKKFLRESLRRNSGQWRRDCDAVVARENSYQMDYAAPLPPAKGVPFDKRAAAVAASICSNTTGTTMTDYSSYSVSTDGTRPPNDLLSTDHYAQMPPPPLQKRPFPSSFRFDWNRYVKITLVN